MVTVMEYAATVSVVALCVALGLSRAAFYRRKSGRSPAAVCGGGTMGATAPLDEGVLATDGDAARNGTSLIVARRSPRALTIEERALVLDELHSPRFVDLAPAEVYATLLDEQRYLCSERTMYRILDGNREVRERRDQLRHPAYAAPQLLATGPNQIWSWDITKLLGPTKWTYFYLYVILDLFSRYVVGWMVADKESAALAQKLIGDTVERQGIVPGQLTIHADRGSSMKSKPVALFMADLGITKTHSRPHVSDDNPFSEAQFKTLKYRPDFPDRFGSLEHSRAHCADFFPWYNCDHHHVGLGLLTPHDVHHGLAEERIARRADVLAAAYAAHPERFVRRAPSPAPLPTAVWINPPKELPSPMLVRV
jgi:putative transposase